VSPGPRDTPPKGAKGRRRPQSAAGESPGDSLARASSTGAVAFQKGKRTKELGVDRLGGMDILTNPDESRMNSEERTDHHSSS
jgi:hypothetical protein